MKSNNLISRRFCQTEKATVKIIYFLWHPTRLGGKQKQLGNLARECLTVNCIIWHFLRALIARSRNVSTTTTTAARERHPNGGASVRLLHFDELNITFFIIKPMLIAAFLTHQLWFDSEIYVCNILSLSLSWSLLIGRENLI